MQQSRVVTFVLALSVVCVFVAAVVMLKRKAERLPAKQTVVSTRRVAAPKRATDDWDSSVVSPAFFGYASRGGVRTATAPPLPTQAASLQKEPVQSTAPPSPTPAAAASPPPPSQPAGPPPAGPPPGAMPARLDPEMPSMYKLLPPIEPVDAIPPFKRVPLQPPSGKTWNPMPAAHRFTFNSSMRNVQEWPEPWRYRLPLPSTLRNVINVTLFKLGMPLSEYLINEYNMWIDVEVGGTVYSVAMEQRNVDVANFATIINTALAQLAVHGINITCALTPTINNTGKLFFSSTTGPFTFLFRTGPHVNRDAWLLFGFNRVDTPSSTTGPPYLLNAPNRYDITGPFAVMLFCDELTRFIETADGMVAHINTTRYIPGVEILFYAPSDVGPPTDRQIFIPIGKLQYLTFNFLVPYPHMEPDGNVTQQYRPYLFNGRNHTIHMLFACREYANPSNMFIELDPQS